MYLIFKASSSKIIILFRNCKQVGTLPKQQYSFRHTVFDSPEQFLIIGYVVALKFRVKNIKINGIQYKYPL